MRINSIIAAGAAAALFMTPAAALAGNPNTDHPGKGQAKREARAEARAEAKANAEARTDAKANAEARTDAKADAPAVPPSQAKAYGKLCQDQSKKHVKGEKGTPFSQCVVAMAHLQSGKAETPKAACKKLSKKHRKGKKGTPFSRCVKAARKLEAEREADTTNGDDSYVDPFGDD
jgi:membrane protein involved in colicin uptake